jgi:hypothetical protein
VALCVKNEKNRLLKKTKIKKGLSVVLMIPAIIIGIALYEQSDFENLKFEKPVLAITHSWQCPLRYISSKSLQETI